jgi:hypothetical protein
MFWARKSHSEKVPPPELSASACQWGTRQNKDMKVFRSVPEWGRPPRPDLMKYSGGITLPEIISNYKHNGMKSYTISELQLYAPTLRITAHGLPPHTTQTETGIHGYKELADFSTRLSGINIPMVTRQLENLCRLSPKRGTTWAHRIRDRARMNNYTQPSRLSSPQRHESQTLRRNSGT